MIKPPPPDLSIILSESSEQRIITFRRFFADLRLYRLEFQLSILNYFSNLDNEDSSEQFARQLADFVSHFGKMDIWLKELKEMGIYPEFREQCFQEIKAIEQIIQSYQKKMNS
jgi:hypothetical protein